MGLRKVAHVQPAAIMGLINQAREAETDVISGHHSALGDVVVLLAVRIVTVEIGWIHAVAVHYAVPPRACLIPLGRAFDLCVLTHPIDAVLLAHVRKRYVHALPCGGDAARDVGIPVLRVLILDDVGVLVYPVLPCVEVHLPVHAHVCAALDPDLVTGKARSKHFELPRREQLLLARGLARDVFAAAACARESLAILRFLHGWQQLPFCAVLRLDRNQLAG
mmetsp:Transcript_68686/g.191557  ORF Transcript_68686/g.191557 Transcript_68686/m.191557 type:complete len:221 (+) Transcript_68686:5189-5851(+)